MDRWNWCANRPVPLARMPHAALAGLASTTEPRSYVFRTNDALSEEYSRAGMIYLHRLRIFAAEKSEPTIVVGSADGFYADPYRAAAYLAAYDKHRTADQIKKLGGRTSRPFGYLSSVEVDDQHLRGGLGRALMRLWIEEARRKKVGDIYLEAYPYRAYSPKVEVLVRFYQSLGFELDPSLSEDGYIMRLKRPVRARVQSAQAEVR